MVGCVEGILGIRPDFHGLRLEPTIPKDWKEVKITKEFRGKMLYIIIQNPQGREAGCSKILLNGVILKEPYIKEDQLQSHNEIIYIL